MKKLLKPLHVAMVIAALAGFGMPSHAHADWHHDDGRRHDDWQGHERWAHDWHRHHPRYEPGYVYAPPAVVEAPEPSPGINLILPLHFH